jgi:hypothetical protein
MRRALLAVAIMVASARAEEAWESGVGADRKHQANALFHEGNELYKREQYQPALARFTQASALWGHPAIQANLAATLIKLERYVEAAAALDAALRFEAAPFSSEQYDVLLNYKHLLAGQLGHVAVRCTQAGATVSLDGKPWLQCPASGQLRVPAGDHVVVGEKPGFVTLSRRVGVKGGLTTDVELELVPLSGPIKYPVAPWIPWSTSGAGLVVAASGLFLLLEGRADMAEFRTAYTASCARGCGATDENYLRLVSDRDRASMEAKAGVTMLAIGGAAAG